MAMRFVLFTFLFLTLATMAQAQQKDPYQKDWKQVLAYQKKGLTESAVKVVESIYARAKKNGHTEQIIKALMHRLAFMQYKEEEVEVKAIALVEAELKTASFPVRPILHSMLAELYQNYIQANQYRLYDRTAVPDFEQPDIRTWDITRLADAVIENYLLSLKTDQEKAKATPIGNYVGILKDLTKENQKLRPTLYDFLAHRVIDGLTSEELYIHEPTEQFTISNPAYFAPAAAFADLKLTSPDSLSYKFYALHVLQDLTRFHLKDKDATALGDVELKRLKLVNRYFTADDNAKLFYKALQTNTETFKKLPVAAEFLYEQAQIYQEATGDSTPNIEKRELYKKAIALYPKSIGGKNSLAALQEIEKSEINIVTSGNLLPQEPVLASITYRNVAEVTTKVYQIHSEVYEKFRFLDYDHRHANGREKTYEERIVELIAGLKPVKEKKTTLPADRDFESHTVQADLPALPLGTYLVLHLVKSTTEGSTQTISTFVHVTNLSLISRADSAESNEILMLHRKSGFPLPKVRLLPVYRHYNQETRRNEIVTGAPVLTSNDGKAIVKRHDNEENQLLYTRLSFEGDTLAFPFHIGRNYMGRDEEDLPEHIQNFFFTDRSIYRPGQTVYFKGIQLKKKGNKSEVVSGESVKVNLQNVNQEDVASQTFTTNSYGSFSGSFVLPLGQLNGEWSLETPHGTISFSVEDYKRPRFEVVFDTLKNTVKTGQIVKVTGHAKAFAGMGLQQATVSFRVVREVILPMYRFGSFFESMYKMPGFHSAPAEIKNGTLQTDENGNFEISFEAVPDPEVNKQMQPIFSFNITADVTDSNGETQTGETAIAVGYQALWLNTNLPEKINKADKTDFEIITTNAGGTPVPSSGTLTFYKLTPPNRAFRSRIGSVPDRFLLSEEEFYRLFPNDLYRSEDDKTKWPEVKVKEIAFNTAQSKKLPANEINGLALGYYVLEMAATDAFGEKVTSRQYFVLFDAASSSLPSPQFNWFTALNKTVKAGEKARFLIGSSAKDVQVLYQVEYQHKIVLSQWISLNQEQKVIEIPVGPDWYGGARFSAVFVKENRFYQNQEDIIITPPSAALNIKFQTFRSKLEPGQKEKWKLIISGPEKEKVAAEMLATMYDASLDKFRPHSFTFYPFSESYFGELFSWGSYLFQTVNSYSHDVGNRYGFRGLYEKKYPYLNWYFYSGGGGRVVYEAMEMSAGSDEGWAADAVSVTSESKLQSASVGNVKFSPPALKEVETTEAEAVQKPVKTTVAVRKNFNETAFFQPHLQTDKKGEVIISFTVPEAITRWKMLGFAHTKDLKFGFTENELVTQKDLMVMPNLPLPAP